MTRTRKSSAARAVPLQQSRSRSSNASSRQRAARSPAPVVLPALEPVSAREARLRQLGLSETMVHHAGKARPASRAMELLGARMEPVKLVQVPGAVMWVDFELARELGFSVPPDNRLTPELHHELIEALSFRVLGEGEQPGDRKVIEGGSERYAGTGQGDSLGAGRAAFLPVLNVNIKGVGRTPLAGPPDPDDYTHSHGGAPAREGLLEAIWGLEADNLFTNKGTRILAVIDTGDDTEWADGTREPRGLIARVGNQYRPAHVLEKDEPYWFKGADFTAPLFLEQARAAGILVEQNGRPDYAATMRNAVDRQALLTAQQFRNRILHGAVSTSNLEWDGGLLDHGTTTSVSRTEPAKVIDHGDAFGTEHTKRARELEYVYLELQAQLASGGGPGARSATPINFTSEMRSAMRRISPSSCSMPPASSPSCHRR
ncbi:MAG: hypothetical protein IPJ65_07350 [Archangiaceae bacterium]|nr:hypothetical protein [Archangiaceae bacterium]